MPELSERGWQRRNKPWRRWMRRRFWMLTRRGRHIHDLQQQLKREETVDAR